MCTRPLHSLSLDHLALLASHPRATPAVQAAFSRALLTWTRERAARLRRRWPADVELDDVIQTFMLRCLTRHLPAWRQHRVALSPYLYRRLVCDACDIVRAQSRHAAWRDEADPDAFIDDARDTEVCLERVATERTLRLVEDVVAALPTRQRLAVQSSLGGPSLGEVAAQLRVHPSTMSREKTAGLTTLRTVLQAAA
jgi:RNA polymerase sigma factor (sigma-70 family)